MANNDKVNLDFKYGDENSSLPQDGTTPALTPGRIYVKKSGTGKAKMFIDTPDISSSERLQIGGNIFVGDPDVEGSGADGYNVIINPNGEVIEDWVTTEVDGGFVIRVESVNGEDIDNWRPSGTPPSKNTILFVIEN